MRIYTLSDPISLDVRYVGLTTQPDGRRLYMHLYECETGNPTHKNNWIKKLKRVGLKPIEETLDNADNLDQLKQLEIYWISQFKAWGFNLTNHTLGGDGLYGFKHSIQARQKMSLVKLGKYSDKQYAALKTRKNVGMKNKQHSEFSKYKNSQSHLKGNLSENTIEKMRLGKLGRTSLRKGRLFPGSGPTKLVYQYSIDNNLIRSWNSMTDIHKELGISISLVSGCCNGKRKTAGGYLWKFS